MKRRHHQRMAGFSLVEVVLALAIAVFCLVPMVGLLPIGFTTNQSSMRQTTAVSLTESVVDDLRATPSSATTSPTYGLTVPSAGSAPVTNTILLTDEAAKTASVSATRPTYLATVVVTPAPAGTLSAGSVLVTINWPAQAAPSSFQGSFQTLVGYVRN